MISIALFQLVVGDSHINFDLRQEIHAVTPRRDTVQRVLSDGQALSLR